MGEKPKVDRYVCKIATMEEVNEKWDTLVREHPDDPNWAVWKKDIIAEISAGGEIPYYGILDGDIICEAYDESYFTVRIRAVINDGLVSWILAQRGRVSVIYPPELAEKVRLTLGGMMAQYDALN